MNAALVAFVVLLAVSCGDAGAGGDGGTATPVPPTGPEATTAPPDPPAADVPELLGLALRQLVTVDTTFGPGHRFDTVLVQASTDPGAGLADPPGTRRPLTAAERDAIENQLAGVSVVQWIEDADEWRTEDLRPVLDNSAIVGVGEPRFDDDGALVPVSLWCGGLCGTWFDYRLVQDGGEWTVVGPEGPVAVS